jgi:hypothetical protein
MVWPFFVWAIFAWLIDCDSAVSMPDRSRASASQLRRGKSSFMNSPNKMLDAGWID